MAPLIRLLFLVSLLLTFVLAAPIPLAADIANKGRLPLHVRAPEPAAAAPINKHAKAKAKRSSGSTETDSNLPLPFLKRFIKASKKVKRATPAAGFDQSVLGKCYYVGADFLTHDCNELLDTQAASINAARTPEQKKIVADFTAKLIAEGKLAAPAK